MASQDNSSTPADSDGDRESTCPECDGNIILSEDEAHRVCSQCGLIVSDQLVDRGPEWRAFNQDERNERSRVGAPTTNLRHDKGLTTQIDWQDKDAYGRSISSEKRSQMNRLRKWQERIRTQNAEERNLKYALSEMNRMAAALGMPSNVQETASVTYRRALSEDMVRGRSIEGVATAALYGASRIEGVPRSLDEMANVARVDRKEISRTYRYIDRELNLGAEPVNPEQYLPRFASDLDLSEDVEGLARNLLEEVAGTPIISGKSPTGLAAAALYIASYEMNTRRTQAEIADVANVTEVTVRNRYQDLVDYLPEADSRGS